MANNMFFFLQKKWLDFIFFARFHSEFAYLQQGVEYTHHNTHPLSADTHAHTHNSAKHLSLYREQWTVDEGKKTLYVRIFLRAFDAPLRHALNLAGCAVLVVCKQNRYDEPQRNEAIRVKWDFPAGGTCRAPPYTFFRIVNPFLCTL